MSLLEVMAAAFLVVMATLAFAAIYAPASRASHMNSCYSQAISAVQLKVDQLRSVGYGRLDYNNLRSAGIIDTTSSTSPFRFEQVDQLSNELPNAVGTITVSSAGTNLAQVTVRIQWTGAPLRAMSGAHQVTILIANIT